MAKVLFIADLHLSEDKPAIIRSFFHFLEHQACSADSLYILGDFFDFWVGDDCIQPWQAEIASALKHYSHQHGLYFIRGNRDFLLGEVFCNQAGLTLLPDTTVIKLDKTEVLLLHGDILCTKERGYQLYRCLVQSKAFRFVFGKLPKKTKFNIAATVRKISQKRHKKHYDKKNSGQDDVQPEAVQKMMQQFNVRHMIHGHTHRPRRHTYQIVLGDSPPVDVTRIVLGDWNNTCWWVLSYSDGAFEQTCQSVI